MSPSLGLVVNGTARSAPRGSSVADLVADVLPAAVDDAGRPRGVAVAVGGEVVPRRRWDDVLLVDGDRVEIVSAVPGG